MLRSELGATDQGETGIPFRPIKGWILPGLVTCFWVLVHGGSLAAWLGDLGSRLSLILTQSFSPFTVTGVPEPEEWVLIGVTLALGAGILYRQRHRASGLGTEANT